MSSRFNRRFGEKLGVHCARDTAERSPSAVAQIKGSVEWAGSSAKGGDRALIDPALWRAKKSLFRFPAVASRFSISIFIVGEKYSRIAAKSAKRASAAPLQEVTGFLPLQYRPQPFKVAIDLPPLHLKDDHHITMKWYKS
jgi:hypothetical protein